MPSSVKNASPAAAGKAAVAANDTWTAFFEQATLLKQTHVNLQNDLRAEQDANKSLSADLRKQAEEKKGLDTEKAQLDKRCIDLEKQVKTVEAAHDKTIKSLGASTRDNDTAKHKLEELERKFDQVKLTSERELEELNEKYARTLSENKGLADTLEETQQRYNKFTTENGGLSSTIGRLRIDHKREVERVNELSDDNKGLRADMEALSIDNKKLEHTNVSIGQQLTRQNEANKSLISIKSELSNALDDAKATINTFKENNDNLQKQLGEKSNKLTNTIENYKRLNSKRNEDQDEIDALKAEQKTHQGQVEALKAELQTHQDKIKALKVEQKTHHEEVEALKKDLAQLESQLESNTTGLQKQYQQEMEQLTQENGQLKRMVDDLHLINEQYQQRWETNAKNLAIAKKVLDETTTMNQAPLPTLQDAHNAPKRLEQGPATSPTSAPSPPSPTTRIDSPIPPPTTTPKRPAPQDPDPRKRRRTTTTTTQLEAYQPPPQTPRSSTAKKTRQPSFFDDYRKPTSTTPVHKTFTTTSATRLPSPGESIAAVPRRNHQHAYRGRRESRGMSMSSSTSSAVASGENGSGSGSGSGNQGGGRSLADKFKRKHPGIDFTSKEGDDLACGAEKEDAMYCKV